MSYKIKYNGIDANDIDWEVEFKVNKVSSNRVTIPESQAKVIKKALSYFITCSEQIMDNINEDGHHMIYDMQQLYAMMDYPISIEISEDEKERFAGNHGIDFPTYK